MYVHIKCKKPIVGAWLQSCIGVLVVVFVVVFIYFVLNLEC